MEVSRVICPMEGKWKYPGPTNQLTGSPEPSSETPRPEEDMNSRTLDYMILHWASQPGGPPQGGAGGFSRQA